jgi:glycosyltransferase involved in cell wall biosynthesis
MNTVTRIDRARRSGDARPDASGNPTVPDRPNEIPHATMPPEFIAQGRRVVFINRYFHPDISATSQVLTDLTRRLAEQRVDVHVICSRLLYEGPPVNLPVDEEVDGVSVHRVWSTRYGRARLPGRLLDYVSFYPSAMLTLLRLTRRGDIVVAKTDPPLLSIAVGPIVRWRSARLVNWLQDVFPEVAGHTQATRLPRPLLRALLHLRDRSLRRADMNVALGIRMRDHLRRRNVPDARLCIVENWAIGEPLRPLPAAASELRRSLDLTDRYVIGYSGNMGLAHDHVTILEAAYLLRDDLGVVFLMVGGGSGMRELEAQARARCLTNLRFLPYQPRERLADCLAASDVHLVTLLPEVEGLVMPSKLYGVMAVGRPVLFVGDAQGEVARVVSRADCGVSVPTGDAHRLIAELLALRNDPARRARLGANAAECYQANYTFEAASARWLEVLRGVIA